MLLFTAVMSVGCGGNESDTLSFYAPDGAPALSIAKFINDGEDFGTGKTIEYNVVSSNDIGGVMAQSKGDFIVMPVNAASKLYKANKSDPYAMLAVITHGNLYIMSSDNTTTLQGLKGKVVGVIGQGLVPDLTLKAVLNDNGLIGDVVVGDTATDGKITLRYFEKATDMIPLLKQGVLTVGLLPEPAATNLTSVANNRTWTRVDLQELYDAQVKAYPQAVLMVKKSVLDRYKNKLKKTADLFDSNLQWIKENVAVAVQVVNDNLKAGVTPSLDATKITKTVIDNCKIYYENATIAKQSVKDYINKIIAIEPSSAVAITDDFFAL
jgi:NitT/TauT family transport system substrate-binding protein